MPQPLALFSCVLLILWLFASDARRRNNLSAALWIPLAWVFILGSKPVSLWFAGAPNGEGAGGYPQDQLVDKALFVFLIAAGLLVLKRRRLDWTALIRNNKWLFAYFLYLGASILWSEESFTSFKRWIKDVGNIVMVLVVLSEEDPVEAVKALLARSAYLLIPLSVVAIKYYPGLSRHYDPWTNQPVYVGLTTDKNTLGMTLFVCGLSLFWLLLELFETRPRAGDKTALFRYGALIVMTGWLLLKARSATAMSCMALGGSILLGMRIPALRSKVKHLGSCVGGIAVVAVLVQASGIGPSLLGEFSALVGRDPTLHGRAEIWQAVLAEDINPLVGTGFYSFWSSERNRRLSETYYYTLGEAHNGYLETYLNSGLIGVALLLAAMVSALKGIKQDALDGSGFGALRLTLWITLLIYNVTESTFDRLVPVWFVLVLVLVQYPRQVRRAPSRVAQRSGDKMASVLAHRVPSAVYRPLHSGGE